jgi:hypothetical protein
MVLRKHPDLETVKVSPEFKEWRKTQSTEVNALGASDIAADAVQMLDLFKASQAAVVASAGSTDADALQAARAQRLKAAAGPAPRSTQAAKSGGELTPKEIWAQEAAERAKRKAA